MEKKQIAGFIVSPDWIENPSLSEKYIREITRQGYGATVIFVRHQKRSVFNERVRDAIAEITDMCHKNNLKVILDTDPSFWAASFVESHPETALYVFKGVDVHLFDGNFEFKAPLPKAESYAPYVFGKIIAVFHINRGLWEQVSIGDVSYEWMNIYQGTLIKGSVRGISSGHLTFYLTYKTFALADLSHPVYLEGQKQLLRFYQGIPLDGFGWDEPGKYTVQNFYKTGEFFPEFFRGLNNYELSSMLIYLDHNDNTPQSVKVRCDYYRTLSEMNFIAQKQHNDYASSLFGDNLIFGTHQTWSGIPADLAAGEMDYFHLGKVLTAAWTDGSWDCSQFKYQAYYFMLAEGLRKELGLRDAYYNDWGSTIPAVENMRFATRFKMLFNINWFNIFFSDFSESLLNYRMKPLADIAAQEVKNLDIFNNFIGDDFLPYTEVAVLYAWEGIASAPKYLVRLYYMMFANLSLNLVDSGIFGAQVSCSAIADAVVSKGFFTIGEHSYKVLLVPYGYVLPAEVYHKIKEMCRSGITVIFFGPAPEFEAENGKDISRDFARMVGFKPFSFYEYETEYAEQVGLPEPYKWEPSWADFTYPVTVTDGDVLRDREGRILYIMSRDLPLYYMPQIDPREDIINLLRKVLPSHSDVFADGTYYRFYSSKNDKKTIIVVSVARGHIPGFDLIPASYGQGLMAPVKEHEIKVLFRFKEGELVMKGGTWCAAKISDGRILKKVGDCPQVLWKKIT